MLLLILIMMFLCGFIAIRVLIDPIIKEIEKPKIVLFPRKILTNNELEIMRKKLNKRNSRF